MTTQLNGQGVVFSDNTTQTTKTDRVGLNRIINGAMEVDQRKEGLASAVNTVTADYISVDRFVSQGSVAGKFIMQQNLNAVTPPSGFSKYLGFKTTTAYAIIAGSYYIFGQHIEGMNIADLKWGTTDAKPVTISFWARSSLTGTFSAGLRNGASNRSYNFTYSLPTANTWTKITVTIPGSTDGVWAVDNSIGVFVVFNMGVGSTFSTSNVNTWEAVNKFGVTGAVSVIGTLNATFFVTGLQVESGSVATEFDRTSYQEELTKCQRYYQIVYASTRCYSAASGIITGPIHHFNTMRTTPTVASITTGGRSAGATATVVVDATSASHRVVNGGTAGDTYALIEKCVLTAEL